MIKTNKASSTRGTKPVSGLTFLISFSIIAHAGSLKGFGQIREIVNHTARLPNTYLIIIQRVFWSSRHLASDAHKIYYLWSRIVLEWNGLIWGASGFVAIIVECEVQKVLNRSGHFDTFVWRKSSQHTLQFNYQTTRNKKNICTT